MENQHAKISGYRSLTQEEIDAMNAIKAFEAQWNGLIEHLKTLPDVDQRNISLAVTYCEDGFSRAVRAVARPDKIITALSPVT